MPLDDLYKESLPGPMRFRLARLLCLGIGPPQGRPLPDVKHETKALVHMEP
jgi:hypothetical protein